MPHIARAAEIELKYGNNLPLSHPLNIRAQEAADRVKAQTNGRVEIKIFPNNQLGGDTDMLSQVRNGGITFFTPSALVIATLVPVAAINAVGFAFADYDQVWKAMDGELGAHVRAAIAKVNLFAFEKIWDNGFRQMTTQRQADRGREGHGGSEDPRAGEPAQPSRCSRRSTRRRPACSSARSTPSLQTKVVDAQENPLPIIQVAKLYEVQKYCALSNHIWDGFWFIANGRAWNGLPDDLQEDRQRRDQRCRHEAARRHQEAQRDACRPTCRRRASPSTSPTPDSFRAKLRDAGFYERMEGALRRRRLGPARRRGRQAGLRSAIRSCGRISPWTFKP